MYTVCMESLQFAWDEKKQPGQPPQTWPIPSQEAQTAFFDERAKVYFDPDHSEHEDQFTPACAIACGCWWSVTAIGRATC